MASSQPATSEKVFCGVSLVASFAFDLPKPSTRLPPKTAVARLVAHATTYADSLAAGHVVEATVTTMLADGMACRVADQAALDILQGQLDHIVQVSDAEVARAMHQLYTDTHNLAEGAGAASFAGAMQERATLKGLTVGTVITGGNVDATVMAEVLRSA